ncbi:FG-GAP repeat domain-containing protein [Archangium violaceum]|uniref:FG-GAP repeat domain-containing protein n=1 Tax=Archangium violaceum TaxID=83451 RepID=UPI0036D7B716
MCLLEAALSLHRPGSQPGGLPSAALLGPSAPPLTLNTAPIPPIRWHIVGAADMNGDGRTDLLWRNQSTGQNEIALMNNTAVLGNAALPVLSLAFYAGATADYTGDGRIDIVWHNPGSGQVLLWRMSGTSLSSTSTIGSMGTGCPAWFSQATPPPAVYGCWYLVGPR